MGSEVETFVSIYAEVCLDYETGEKFYLLGGEGWKGVERTQDDPQFHLESLPVGSTITLTEPVESACREETKHDRR